MPLRELILRISTREVSQYFDGQRYGRCRTCRVICSPGESIRPRGWDRQGLLDRPMPP